MKEIKDGDVFNWQWKDEKDRFAADGCDPYWCKDAQCFAVERNGSIFLIDTYWNDYDQKVLSDSLDYINLDKVDLEFICNLHDTEEIQHYEAEDYDKVYNLSRQKNCYKHYRIDKDAQPSNKAMIAKLERQLQRAHEDLRSAQWSIERISKEIEEVK
ncbi:hypothetical protein D3C85_631980 [compost metagenome]